MNVQYFKDNTKFLPLLLFLVMKCAYCSEQQKSIWRTTVEDCTAVAKDLGLKQANEACSEFMKDDNTCREKWRAAELWREVEGTKITILECNKSHRNQFANMSDVSGICQLKSWFVILMIILIIILCLILLGCISCCALGYCCCCCRR